MGALALLAGQVLATSVTISAGSGGGGVFYAIHRSDYVTDTTGSETTSKYGTSDSKASEFSLGTIRFFSYAFPNCGYNFQGWATSASGSPASGYTTPIEQYYGISAGSDKIYYARFASGATVRDIYLCVGDQVTLYFYDATTGVSSSNPKWVTRLNDGTGSAFWTDTGAKAGNGATFTRSTASTSKAFSIQIKATTAGKTDTLVVRDTVVTAVPRSVSYDPKTYSVNTYHYRIHVSAARSLQEWTDTTITANSSISRAWSVSGVNTSLITVNNSAGSSASSSPTFTVHGVNYSASSPTATFTASNYDSGTTTGERGVSYTYSIPMTEAPKKTYYASATAAVSGSGGKAYVSSASTENAASYTTSQTSAGPLSAQSKYASAAVGDFYLWAMPDFGYKCTGWGKGSSGAAVSLNYAHNASPITVTSSATSSSSPQTESYYAHFSNSGVAVKDIYLAVGDRVQLFYYNSTYAPFSARVNATMLTATSATAGSYATYVRSAANTAAVQAFNMTVTATTASGSSYDQLTVQDHQGNVYHYRIHVTAARDVRIGTPSSVSEQSYYSAGWIVTVPSASSSYVSATVLPTGNTDSPTITFTGKAATASAVTVQVSNYDELPTTGCLGATYTYSMTVTDPPSYTYYARVATVVVGASGSGIGQGWAYASRKRKEDSSVYQTTRSVSELGSKKLYEDLASTEVDGFYIFAFPNSGYRFEGWSVDDPNGPIVSTEAFSASGASVSVTSTSKTQASPAEVTYYAHFVRADERVKDITLAVGDSVRLFFNNTTACNWSLQVVYTNGTEQVVNLDDTVAHAGGYANYTRSASTAPASASMAFNMLVEATRASGNDYDQLTIEDYAGNVYHYHVHVVDRRVIERHDTAVFSADSFAANVWSQSGIDTSVLTVSTEPIGVATNSATVHATGALKCKDSRFTVSNYAAAARTGELGATYTFGMNVVEPWPVEFCQGDEVVIYYHNSVKKNWYLLINGNRVEPNVAGRGAQMTVTLSADNPDDDTEILGVATTPGTGSGDLVIVTDGENFYPYRMAVRPRRVIGLGESRSMKCSTVATSPWRYQVPSASAYYVDTDFSPNEDEGHSATITLTGKQPGKNVIVYVANFERDDASVNAQGAYYTLVTDVIGARTRGVYMSQGTSVTWGESYLDATPSSTYSVTPSEANLMTAAIASNTATTVFTTLTAPDNAVPYTTALFTVKDQADADVAKYDVMAYGIMSMAVGQVAPGCLNGSATPWVMESSNPAKFSAEPTIYNKLNSGRMEAKAPGDFSVWATNAADQVYWYSIRVQVYDEVTRLIAIPDNGTTNITISAEPGLAAKWSLAQDCAHITASLDNTSTAADHVTLTVTGGTVEGSHVVQVNNAFHHERIEVFVGANPGQTVVKAGSLKFTAYNTVDLPGEAPPAAWTAQLSESAAGKFSLVAASGAAGEKVQVYGIAPGTGQVIVKTASTIYVYDVEVAKNDGKLSDVTVGAGYTFTTNLTDLASDLAGATLYAPPVLTNATTGTRIYYAIESTAAYRAETNYVIQAITPHPATVTVGEFSKLRREPDPAFSAVVSGLLAGEESVASTFVYGYTREPGEDVGTNAVYATGATVQGNYTITYVPGHLEILPWLYPVGPNGEKIPIEEAWIGGKGGDDKINRFQNASNYVFSEGNNGYTNWVSYVLGLDPTNVNSIIYIDIEPNRASVKDPTLVARGAKVRPMPIGSLTNVLFRLMKCNSRTGTYERVTDTHDGRFPQTNVPTDFFRAETLFEFEKD